jgi:hypothetical protein
LLGFDALGKLALGQLPPNAPPIFYGSQWQHRATAVIGTAVLMTTLGGFVPQPPVQDAPTDTAKVFSTFAEPVRPPLHHLWLPDVPERAPVPPPTSTAIFSDFLRKPPSRSVPAHLQQSVISYLSTQAYNPTLEHIYTFSDFTAGFVPFKHKVGDWIAYWPPIILPFDTHDLDQVYVKKKKKKNAKTYDPARDELDIRAKRRGAIYDALVPKVEYSLPDLVLPPRLAPPPNVEELAQLVMAARQQAEMEQKKRELAADDDDLELILKDIL